MPTTDPAVSGFAWSPTADPAAEWWTARVYFDGVPTRRIDAAAALSAAPGTSEWAVRAFLASAEPADARTDVRPPWYWDARVYFDGVPTPRRAVRAAMLATGVPAAGIAAFLDTAEFAGDHYNEDQSRADGKFGSGGGSAKGGAAPDADPEFRKAVAQVKRTEAKHQSTAAKVAAGGTVSDKALKDAHDHFTKWHGYHDADAKAASGPDGKPAPGSEFVHDFHRQQADKHAKNLAVTGGELQKRGDAHGEKANAKEDAKHDKTVQKLNAGKKVDRAAVQAAHDHYSKRYDAHGETLAKMAGKNGKSLHTIPPDVHGKLTEAMLDAAGRHEKLKGHLDAHDKAKAEKDRVKADKDKATAEKVKAKAAKAEAAAKVKAEKAAKVAEKTAGGKPKAPAPAKPPAHAVKRGLQRAFAAAAAPTADLPAGQKKIGQLAGGAAVGRDKNGDPETHFAPGQPEKQAARLGGAVRAAMTELKLFTEFEDGMISVGRVVHEVQRTTPAATTADVVAALSHMGDTRQCELHALNETQKIMETSGGNCPLPGAKDPATAALWKGGRALAFVMAPRGGFPKEAAPDAPKADAPKAGATGADTAKHDTAAADLESHVQRFRKLDHFGTDDGDERHARIHAEADKVVAGIRAKHTDKEIIALARTQGNKAGNSVAKAMKMIHHDLVSVSNLRESQRV